MAESIIYVPRLNDDPADFKRLFDMWHMANGYFEDVRFDFSNCGFLRPNAVAFLGGLARLIESRCGNVVFDWSTLCNSWVMNTIRQNGFASKFGDDSVPWDGTSIPYREDPRFDPDGMAEYLSERWLGKGSVHVSEPLKNAIVERVLELYVNAFEHSESRIGVFSCGQYFKSSKELHLTLVDFGIGIPASVRAFIRQRHPDLPTERLPGYKCLNWAFQNMHTTKPDVTSRGAGLDLLKSFIRINRGTMVVYSNDSCATITAQQETFEAFAPSFGGTLFHIILTCDETHYSLASEKSNL